MWGIRDGTQAVPDNDKDVIGVAEGVKLSGLLGGLSVFSHSLTVFDFAFCALAALLCQKGRGVLGVPRTLSSTFIIGNSFEVEAFAVTAWSTSL